MKKIIASINYKANHSWLDMKIDEALNGGKEFITPARRLPVGDDMITYADPIYTKPRR